jgi:hypothetical protein
MVGMLAVVAHRRWLVRALKPLRQRPHDRLDALAPGRPGPAGHARRLLRGTPTGHAVMACAVAFAGRPPSVRSLNARERPADRPIATQLGEALGCSGSLYPRSALTTSPDLASLLRVVLALPRGIRVAAAISPAVFGPSLSASRIFARV